MCGINGFTFTTKRKDIAQNKITQMNLAIRHRGPDASSYYMDDHISFGHVLLSIRGDHVDKSTQPYLSSDNNWVLVFNGEIYNTEQLCRENGLPQIDLDTEVLIRLIEKKGWDFVCDIEGMFTIGLYNKSEGVLRLYRDVTGQKCLYYFVENEELHFSSEIKSLLPHLSDKDSDLSAIEIALTVGYIPAPWTMFKNIKKIKPGECLRWDTRNRNLTSFPIAKVKQNIVLADHHSSHNYLSKQIQLHSLSKQKVGINLSGGLDSSIVFYELAKNDVICDTYTTVFDTNRPDIFNEEAEIAKKMSKEYGVKHHEIHITKKKYLNNLIESFETVEEPNHNIGLPHYLILAKEQGISGDGIRVLLAGDGGDEVFAGYEYYYENANLIKQTNQAKKIVKNLLFSIENKFFFDLYNPSQRWIYAKSFRNEFKSVNLQQVYKKIISVAVDQKSLYENKSSEIYQLMLMDRMVWLTGENFIRTDKIFMSQSIEIRSPFSYYPIRTYFDSLLKDENYGNEQFNKLFLRQMYHDRLPKYVVNRERKWGWKPPWDEWFDSQCKEIIASIFEGLPDSDMIRWQQIRNKILSEKAWPGREYWSYVSLAILAKKYKMVL